MTLAYCSTCKMRTAPAPNLCTCQPSPVEHIEQIIAERDALRAQVDELAAAIKNALISIRICAMPPVAGVATNAQILQITVDGLTAALKRVRR